MIVVTDTSLLRYLIVLGWEELLPRLYGTVLCPETVLEECRHHGAPAAIQQWAAQAGMIAVGTVGILSEAARRGWIDYDSAILRLGQETNFRLTPAVIELGRHYARSLQ